MVILGAGPTGLYATYCAGFRGLSAVVVDALPEVGGQITALYPEKLVRDVAGIVSIPGRQLVESLKRQADTYQPTYLLGTQAVRLGDHADGGRILELADGTVIVAKSVLITAGIGTFIPRPLPAGEAFLGRGLSYFVPSLDDHAGRDVVVVGGGDSAIDWALALAPLAASVTVVHRRRTFRAHAASVAAAVGSGVTLRTEAQVTTLYGRDWLEGVHVTDASGASGAQPATSVIAALGFVSDLGPLASWGLTLSGRSIQTDQQMRTNLPGVYAAGDIADFHGKVRLMSVAFGEAATAVSNAAVDVDPTLTLFPGHSTDLQTAQRILGVLP